MTRALIIGSIAVDQLVWLDQPLRVGGHHQGRELGRRVGGGAANTAMALASGGGQPILLSAVGRDAEGDWLLEQLGEQGVDTRRVHRGDATTRSLVLVDPEGERSIVNLQRAQLFLPADLDRISADLCYVRSADPALTPVLDRLRQRMPLILHLPPWRPPGRACRILLGSRSDLPESLMPDPWSAGRAYAGRELEWVILTDGARGVTAWSADRRLDLPATPARVVNSTGAGDAFAAGLLRGLGAGLAMREALELACHWGAEAVGWDTTRPQGSLPQPLASHNNTPD